MAGLSLKHGEPVILVHKIDFTMPEALFQSLSGKISKSKRARISKFKFRDDALRGLFGELLLKYGLEKIYGITYSDDIFSTDNYGKPHLIDGQIYFNISHSGDWSCIIFHKAPAGIDVEQITEPPFEIMPRNFTTREIEQIENTDRLVKAKRFYEMWTLKESYIKMHGKGLSLALDSFSIDLGDRKKIKVIDENSEASNIRFILSYLDSYHVLSVCLNDFDKEISQEHISLTLLTGEN